MIVGITITLGANLMSENANNREIELNQNHLAYDPISDPICFVVDRASSGETGSGVTMDTCLTLKQFEEMGCTKPMLEHILRYSNLLDEEIDGPIYLDWAGLPDGITQEKFQECFDAISEKRTLIKEISDLKFRQSNCENFGGIWLSEPNECEGITEAQCSQMNAAYSEESSCRYYPNLDDCFESVVSVCSEYSESDYNLQLSDCPEGQTYNEILFKCVISCEEDLVYNGYTDSCTTEFELKYHGFCNDGYTYQPPTHLCLSDGSGFPVNLSHEPLKDPPRTAPPEPESSSITEKNLIDARNKLREVYHVNASLGPLNIKDVIVGYGIGDGFLVVDVLEEYYNSDEYYPLIIQKIIDITDGKVDIEFNSSGAIVPTNIESIFPHIWNGFLHRNGIEFTPKDQSYANNDIGYDDVHRVCSPVVASNGTELYISSVFVYEPFEITGTFIDKIKPDDCYKVWKTDAVLEEPDRILMLWLENYHREKENEN